MTGQGWFTHTPGFVTSNTGSSSSTWDNSPRLWEIPELASWHSKPPWTGFVTATGSHVRVCRQPVGFFSHHPAWKGRAMWQVKWVLGPVNLSCLCSTSGWYLGTSFHNRAEGAQSWAIKPLLRIFLLFTPSDLSVSTPAPHTRTQTSYLLGCFSEGVS